MVRAFVEINSKCAGAEFFLVPRELFRNKANETSNPETGVSHVIEGRRRVRKEGEGLGRREGGGGVGARGCCNLPTVWCLHAITEPSLVFQYTLL